MDSTRNMEAGTEAETMEHAAYWVVPQGLLSLFLLLVCFFNTTQNHLLMDGTAHNGLGPPTPIINQ